MDMDYKVIWVAFQAIAANPWFLAFAFLWVIGWLLKEWTPLNNKLIPTVLIVIGALIGYAIIAQNITGAIIGVLMGYIIIAFYEHIKNTIEYFVLRKNEGA